MEINTMLGLFKASDGSRTKPEGFARGIVAGLFFYAHE